MSRGRENAIEIRGDVSMLTPNFRSILGLIYEGGYLKANGTNELVKAGYIELSFEKSGGLEEYNVTSKGEAILKASDRFWNIVWEKFHGEEENKKTLLTPKNYHLLYALHSFEDGLTVDGLLAELEGVVVENRKYDKTFASSLVDGMQRKGLVDKNIETGRWSITEFGEVILKASYEFYEQLFENGFYENGTEDQNEGGPVSARDTFWEDRFNTPAE